MSFAQGDQVDDSLIDRLVDGELREVERQRILALLETEVGGWRRCALAFLEAQAWSRTLASNPNLHSVNAPDNSTITHVLIDPDQPVDHIRQRRAPTPRWFPFQSQGILAAGILLSFAAGWIASRAAHPFRPVPAPIAADKSVAVFAPTNRLKPAVDQVQAAEPRNFAPVEPPIVPKIEAPSRKIEAPVALTEPIRREWERQGYLVQQRSGLVSMELENGERLAVPVDEVELRYIGNRTY